MEKPTTELLHILEKIEPKDMDQYIDSYGKQTDNKDIFLEYMTQNQLDTREIVKRCQGMISKSYIYDLLNGKKQNPSRDILLILCVAARMNRKMVRRVLETYGQPDLYAKDTRDIIIATYINNKIYDFDQINEELYRYQLPLLHEKT